MYPFGQRSVLGFISVALLPYLALAIGVITYGNDAVFLYLNRFTSNTYDLLFQVITILGDGWITAAIGLVFIASKPLRVYALPYWLAFGFSALCSYILKHWVWPEELRPWPYFRDMGVTIRLVPGMKNNSFNSFPSGHTITGFFMFSSMALIFRKPIVWVFCSIAAIAVAYSRIYLAQHHPVDILAGAPVGLLSTLFIFYLFRHKINRNEQDRLST